MKCWNLTFGYDSDHQSSVFLGQRLKYLLKCVINHIWGNSSHVYLFYLTWHEYFRISSFVPISVSTLTLSLLFKRKQSTCCFWFAASQLMILCLSSSWHIPSLRYFFCRWLLIFTCTYVCSAKPKHCDNTSPSQVMSLPPGYKVKSWNGSAHPGTSFISLFLLSPWRWWAFSLGKPQRQPGLWSLMFSPCLPS